LLRLQQSGAGAGCPLGHPVGIRRSDPVGGRLAFRLHPNPRPPRCRYGRRRVPVQHSAPPPGCAAGSAEPLCAVAGPHDRAYRDQFRISDRRAADADGHRGAGSLCRVPAMTTEQTPSRDKSWSWASIGLAAVLVLLTTIAGLILLPSLQTNASYSSLWDAICSAAGVLRPSTSQPPIEPTFKISQVVLTSGMLRNSSQESIGRG